MGSPDRRAAVIARLRAANRLPEPTAAQRQLLDRLRQTARPDAAPGEREPDSPIPVAPEALLHARREVEDADLPEHSGRATAWHEDPEATEAVLAVPPEPAAPVDDPVAAWALAWRDPASPPLPPEVEQPDPFEALAPRLLGPRVERLRHRGTRREGEPADPAERRLHRLARRAHERAAALRERRPLRHHGGDGVQALDVLRSVLQLDARRPGALRWLRRRLGLGPDAPRVETRATAVASIMGAGGLFDATADPAARWSSSEPRSAAAPCVEGEALLDPEYLPVEQADLDLWADRARLSERERAAVLADDLGDLARATGRSILTLRDQRKSGLQKLRALAGSLRPRGFHLPKR